MWPVVVPSLLRRLRRHTQPTQPLHLASVTLAVRWASSSGLGDSSAPPPHTPPAQGSSGSVADEEHLRPSSAARSSGVPQRGGGQRSFRRTQRAADRRRAASPRKKSQRDAADDALVPRSLDIGAVEGLVDVERFFPQAVAHLKATPASPEAADQAHARRWHATTHDVNADGFVSPLQRAARERREGGAGSFFDEGSIDVRGGMANKLRSGAHAGAREARERDSPDILKLTGGNARRHGGLGLATESNAAPADQTIEGDRGDHGAYAEFGDTPVQLTDMLRERLMELKAETLREERSETFLPQRLRHRAADSTLLALAQRGDAAGLPPKAAHLPRSPRSAAAAVATTLADLGGAEDAAGREAGEEGAAASAHEDRAILRDGVPSTRVAAAMRAARGTDDSVPGGSPTDDPLRRLAALAAQTGRSAVAAADAEDDAAAPAEAGVERPGLVYLLRTLPRAGFCSRREAAVTIASGQVRVNNVVERNPFRLVRAEDDVHVAGHHSRLRFAPPRLWMYHKPANVVVSRNDVAGRTLITKHARILGMDHLVPVGSLPMRAHGILLLTNDGELSRFLENPKSMVQRTYLLRVRPALDPVLVHKLNTEGLDINGRRHRNVEFFVNPATKSRYSVKVKVRGESMPIAHLMQHLGRTVERGGRISFGPFALTNLAVGSVREVTVPPFYTDNLGAVWKPFVERDWPFFRRQRVSRLRRLCRYRELTPKELEELDNYTYEEVKDALSFESSELQALAEQRAQQSHMAARLGDHHVPLPSDFPASPSSLRGRRAARGAGDEDVALDLFEGDGDDSVPASLAEDAIVEDITALR